MKLSRQDCCVLNSGSGAWAFEPLARQLASGLGIAVSDEPRRFNYLLQIERPEPSIPYGVFIPFESVRLASDKRLLASAFIEHRVPTPRTRLFEDFKEVSKFLHAHSVSEWCLKYPTGCGANGHRMLAEGSQEPPNWPRPFIVQEFIRLPQPEVFRTYCAAGELFGWVVRRFPEGAPVSPWVAHAKGAHYVSLGEAPVEACQPACQALGAAGLWNSFGCVDLLRRPTGEWVVLEVGTDGLYNHVDRDLGDPEFEGVLNEKVATAVWAAAGKYERTDSTFSDSVK
jgi:hypothetical protein